MTLCTKPYHHPTKRNASQKLFCLDKSFSGKRRVFTPVPRCASGVHQVLNPLSEQTSGDRCVLAPVHNLAEGISDHSMVYRRKRNGSRNIFWLPSGVKSGCRKIPWEPLRFHVLWVTNSSFSTSYQNRCSPTLRRTISDHSMVYRRKRSSSRNIFW